MISRSKKKSTNQENYARGFLWSCEARKDICCFLCHVLLVLCNEYTDENTCSSRSVSWGAMLNMKHVAEPWTGPGPFEISWPILCIVTLNQCQHVPPFHTTVSIWMQMSIYLWGWIDRYSRPAADSRFPRMTTNFIQHGWPELNSSAILKSAHLQFRLFTLCTGLFSLLCLESVSTAVLTAKTECFSLLTDCLIYVDHLTGIKISY